MKNKQREADVPIWRVPGNVHRKRKRGKQNSEIEKGKDNKIWKGRTSARAVYQIFLHSGLDIKNERYGEIM